MAERPLFGSGPLSRADAEQIEATLLPNLDRHHLRLLAHCLRGFAVPRSSATIRSTSGPANPRAMAIGAATIR